MPPYGTRKRFSVRLTSKNAITGTRDPLARARISWGCRPGSVMTGCSTFFRSSTQSTRNPPWRCAPKRLPRRIPTIGLGALVSIGAKSPPDRWMLLALGLAASAEVAGVYLWTGEAATESRAGWVFCARRSLAVDARAGADSPPATASHEARKRWKRTPCDGVKEPRLRWSIAPPRESPDTRRDRAQFRCIVAKRTCRARPRVYTNLGGSCKDGLESYLPPDAFSTSSR